MKPVYFLAVILFFSNGVLAQAPKENSDNSSQPEKKAQYKRFMDTAVERGLFRGVAVVVESGEVAFEFAHGDLKSGKRKLSIDSSFYLASLSKQFTATAIILLQQDGKLSFDDRVSKHLSELPKWSKEMTIRHLLTHTSGLGDYLQADLKFDGLTNADVLEHINSIDRLEFAPGTRYRYSNSGYALLAQIVEQVSEQSFREFTSERIFAPLNMDGAMFMDHTKPKIKNRVISYDRFFQLADSKKLENGAGGMYGSARDLVKWHNAIFDASLLNRESLDAAFQPTRLNDGSESDYGFGWHVHKTATGKAIHHTGSLGGFRHFVFADLAKKNVVILLTRGGDSFPLPQMATGMTNILRGKKAVVPLPSLADHLFSIAKNDTRDLAEELKNEPKFDSQQYRIIEDELNDLGYTLLAMKRLDDAISVFQLAVASFPESANVYDSFGEALMLAGNLEASEQNYQRSLEIDPENDNATMMLQRLGTLRQEKSKGKQTPSQRRLDDVVACINEDNKFKRQKFLAEAFQDQSRDAIEERMAVVSEMRAGLPKLVVSKVVRYDETHIIANCTSSNGSVLEIYLATDSKKPYSITEIEMEMVKTVVSPKGDYVDVAAIPKGQVGTRISKLFEAFNSNDTNSVKQFLKSNSSLGDRDLVQVAQTFATAYRENGELKFHSIRQYSEPKPNGPTVIISKAKLADKWKAVVVNFDSDNLIERVRFAPAREPKGVAKAKPLTREQARESIKQFLDQLESSDSFSGSILVAVDEDIVAHRAMGLASRRFQVPNRTDTKFNLASMNKTFTGVAICQLAEAGKLSLEDSVDELLSHEWLPQKLGKKIKIRHLLTHTSGVASYVEAAWENKNNGSFDGLGDYKSAFQKERFNYFEPGESYRYSNTGMFLLGVVIEKVSGKSYYEYVRENILQPANMTDTGFFSIQSPVPNLAIGYYEKRGEIVNNNHTLNRGGPAGGGYSTTKDLFNFSKSLSGNRLLTKQMTELATSAKPEWKAPQYGLGFQVRPESGLMIFGHSGGSEGVSTRLDILPDLGITVIVLANMDFEAENVAKKLRNILGRIQK